MFFTWNNSWEQRHARDDRRRPDARGRGIRERQAAKQKPPAVSRKEEERFAKTAPSGPLVAVVSLASQRIRVYGSDGLIAQSAVSTGRSGHRTPTGVFSVIQKRRYHESNIYSNAPMPWMQRLTWSGIALHGGVVPGHPASHGCIRLTYDFAPQMWTMTRTGARVIVAPNDVGVSEFSHPRLPVPAMTSLNVAGDGTGTVVEVVADARSSQTLTDKGPAERAAEAAPKAISPLDRMRLARREALAEGNAAEKALSTAQVTARKASAEANAARVTLRRAQAALKVTENRLAAVLRLPEGNKSRIAAEPSRRAAFEAARAKAVDAVANEALVSEAAALAVSAVRAAQAVKDQTSAAVKLTTAGQEPVSVFISRKAGRVFVRQGFTPLLDEAVIIRDAEMPIGTHVFTALAAENGGATLRWSAVSVPDAGANFALGGRARGTLSYEDSQKPPPVPSTAAEALDRIEIPAAVSAEVANRLWAGASLIISDQGLSNETGQGTDFIVLTK